MSGVLTSSRRRPPRRQSRLAAVAMAGVLFVSGCAPNPPEASTTSGPAGTAAGPGPSTPAPTAVPPGPPSKVFTDRELTAIGAAMLQQRNQSPSLMFDSQRLRTGYASRPYPVTQSTAQPAECGAFHPPVMDDALHDLSMNFASGPVPIAGESGPTTTILFTIRSAPKDKLAKADFDYTDDLVSRCARFDISYEPADGTPYKTMLLKPPSVGEKAYAVMSPSDSPMHPLGGVGLRVLAGTISISMSLSVSPLNSEADAQPAVGSMASVAQQLIDQAAQNPPTVSPLPPNARTPEQLTALLEGVNGPEGNTVDLASGSVIGAVPGTSPTASASPSLPPCTFSDSGYYSSLLGATMAQGEMPGATKMEYLSVRLISMPSTASVPYPFDARAAALRDCSTIQEEVYTAPGTNGSLSQWSSVHRLSLNLAADSVYAIAHEHPDGGVWHLLVGARKGSLTVELDAIKNTEADLQPGADKMAAIISQVFAKAGL